jgi:hypothetical protein
MRRRSRTATRLVVLLAASAMLPAANAASTDWSVQATPNPHGGATLFGVSCPSDKVCIAVGGSRQKTTAARWNGSAWKALRSVNPKRQKSWSFNAVSCPAVHFCVAVGGSYTPHGNDLTLAERWNGHRWSGMSAPTPTGVTNAALRGVSCSSARRCMAVGGYGPSGQTRSFSERWNGHRWRIAKTVNPDSNGNSGALYGVSCPTRHSCYAVGWHRSLTLAEHWNGHRWRQQATSKHGVLNAISCVSASECTAVGGIDRAIAYRWNGRSWRFEKVRQPPGGYGADLTGVSCPTAGSCVASGYYFFARKHSTVPRIIVERWDGTRWRSDSPAAPHRASADLLEAASCSSAAACTVVGEFQTRSNAKRTLAERQNAA